MTMMQVWTAAWASVTTTTTTTHVQLMCVVGRGSGGRGTAFHGQVPRPRLPVRGGGAVYLLIEGWGRVSLGAGSWGLGSTGPHWVSGWLGWGWGRQV